MYKILAGVLMSILVTTASVAKDKSSYMSSKPAACMDTNPMLKKFTDDKNEQIIFKYKDPIHNSIGMIFYNPVLKTIHAVELPPARGGVTACVIVFGNEVQATSWKSE